MVENAAKAIKLAERKFTPNPIPPSPPLKATSDGNKITLNWEWRPEDGEKNPLDSWDDQSEYLGSLPDTNWRRRNPPPGHVHRGRNFGGFKLWRSVGALAPDSNFVFMGQFNVEDDPSVPYHTGLQYSFVDSNLRIGNYYTYAVTSYSYPEVFVSFPFDTLFSNIVESKISDNAKLIRLPFSPSKKLGEVKVVPNPYRGDIYYTDGNGYEGDERTWTVERKVVWFTHLPSHATIRIFTIAGDLITSIYHDDAARTGIGLPIGQEEWKLFSESGRPITSGLYVFTVESEFGTQVGKFVIIL